MINNAKKFLVFVVIFISVVIVAYFIKNKTPETKNTDIKISEQAVVSSQATVNGLISNYVDVRSRNIQKEKEVAKNAVQDLCKMYSDDGDALIGWAELVARARRYNGQWSDSTD